MPGISGRAAGITVARGRRCRRGVRFCSCVRVSRPDRPGASVAEPPRSRSRPVASAGSGCLADGCWRSASRSAGLTPTTGRACLRTPHHRQTTHNTQSLRTAVPVTVLIKPLSLGAGSLPVQYSDPVTVLELNGWSSIADAAGVRKVRSEHRRAAWEQCRALPA